MNPLAFFAAAVLAAGLLTLAVSVLLRPPASHPQLTVADLQARLALEAARTPRKRMPPRTEGRARAARRPRNAAPRSFERLELRRAE